MKYLVVIAGFLLCACGAPTGPAICHVQADTVITSQNDTVTVNVEMCVSHWRVP